MVSWSLEFVAGDAARLDAIDTDVLKGFDFRLDNFTHHCLESLIMLAHNVYFTLFDSSPAALEAMVAACQKYLKDHPGVVFFAAGTCAEDLVRPVNDRLFHVALHVIFDTRENQDRYQTASTHLQFIEENKAKWKQVRVFDSNC